MTKNNKKLYIETLGCAMNVRDSEHIVAELRDKEGFSLTDKPDEADLILINTCSVREKPVHKLFSEIGTFKKIKKENAKIGICGCTASHLGKKILQQAPIVSFVLGARNVSKITQALHTDKFVETDIGYDESEYAFGDFRSSLYKAYINISIGCDKNCTYCIVPHTRGREISIPPAIIINEVQKAVKNGAKEIFLLGQNVNNYGVSFSDLSIKKIDFSDLLDMVSEIDGVERIRFTSPHPLHMDDKFLQTFATNPKICKSMHMPLQSGSTRILKRMKRGYSKEWFLERALKLRDMVKNVHIGTDVIVGFPGESDRDFEDTLDVVQKVQFEQMFSFNYSPRPLTKAADFSDQIPHEISSKRLKQLQNLHTNLLDEIVLRQKGKIFDVLFEEMKDDEIIAGRSDNNFMVQTKGKKEYLGKIMKVKIDNPRRMILYGEIIDK